MITPSRPDLQNSDFSYIRGILKSHQVAAGPLVDQVNRIAKKYVGTRYAEMVSSGTAALHLGLLASGIGPGDEVIIPSYTCAAVFQAVQLAGARPVLADIDPELLNLTPETVRPLITKRTRAVLVTHTFGLAAPLKELLRLRIPLIEDCSHALGTTYHGKPVGRDGLFSIASLYATKMLCSGQGGIFFTNQKKINDRFQDLNGPDKKNDLTPRFQYQTSDLSAGLALSQLKRLPSFVNKRLAIASRYNRALATVTAVSFPDIVSPSRPNYYRYVIFAQDADRLMRLAFKAGIHCDRPVAKPLHHYLRSRKKFPGTEQVFRQTVSIPIYPALTSREVSYICAQLSGGFR